MSSTHFKFWLILVLITIVYPCQDGFFQLGNLCPACSSNCLTCTATSTYCLSCVDPIMYVLKDNTCLCSDGYFTHDTQCQLCNPQCVTCQYNADYCLKCKDINHILTNSNECICKVGYLTIAGYCSQCESPCFSCIYNTQNCTECLNILVSVDSNNKCKCTDGQYYDSNWNCLICDINCKTCSAQFTCQSCYELFYLNISICEPCQSPCVHCLSLHSCINCVDGFYLSGRSCLECQKGCLLCDNALTCLFCQDGYFLNSMNQCQICKLPCDTCVSQDNLCLSCQNSNMILLNNSCLCQLGYYYFQNQYSQCISPCLLCISDTYCTSCIENSIILRNNQCICLDGYFFNGSSCQICNQSCLTCKDNQNLCTSCDQQQNRILQEQNKSCNCLENFFNQGDTLCQKCTDIDGIQLKECNYYNCGDGIWTWGEACDDGNDQSRDGCSNCQIDKSYSCKNTILQPSFCFPCIDNCLQCDQQCQICQQGYYLENNYCNQCPYFCLSCSNQLLCQTCRYFQLNGKCVECEAKNGYFSDSTGCNSICGNGIKSDLEQCDDGNILDNDGCNSNCQLESGYFIENGVIFFKTQLQPFLYKLSSSIYDPTRIFILNYNEPIQFVDLKNESLFQIQIADYSLNKDFSFQIQDQSTNLTQMLIKFNMRIILILNKTTENKNITIEYGDIYKFKNLAGSFQKQNLISSQIDQYIYVDENTKEATQGTIQANYYLLYIIISLIALSILFGGIETFYNFLDIMQIVSYLQYVNTQFPYNLDNYINLFQFAQFQWLNQYISILSLYEGLIDKSLLIQAPSKISNDGFSGNFIINMSSLITVWATFVGTYIIAHIASIIIYKINIDLQIQSNQIIKWFKYLLLLLKQYILKQCEIIIRSFFFSGFFRTYISTTYDFAFYLMLNLNELTFTSSCLINNLSSYVTIFSSILYITIIFSASKIMESKANQLKNYNIIFGSVYEGLKLNGIGKLFNIFILLKKFLFMGSLILLYYYPIFQIIQLLFLTLIQLIFLILFKPIENKIEWKKQIYCEVLIFVTEYMLMILVVDDVLQLFVYETRNLIGWIIISCISSMLITQIIFDLRQKWFILVKIYNMFNNFIQKKYYSQEAQKLKIVNAKPNNGFQK